MCKQERLPRWTAFLVYSKRKYQFVQINELTDFCKKNKRKFDVMNIEPVVNASFDHLFRFSQEQVIQFAELTGDNNPLHLDAEFAATTSFKRPIIHGMLGATVFTKVLGTQFPGFGSIYLKQTVEFLRPMFVDTDYKAVFTIKTIDPVKHIAEISTEIVDVNTKKVVTRGIATMINQEKF